MFYVCQQLQLVRTGYRAQIIIVVRAQTNLYGARCAFSVIAKTDFMHPVCQHR